MLDFSTVNLKELIIHRVGNKHNEEDFLISNSAFQLTEEMDGMVLDYFVKPFLNNIEVNHFHHEVDLSYHPLNGISKDIFNNPESLYINSVKITTHLHEQSNHPHIKPGDVFVAYFDDILFEDKMVNAIGIFKSEAKTSFLKVLDGVDDLSLGKDEGIDIKKLDKGCFIINAHDDEGYRVFSVDGNKYDTEYWYSHFLGLQPLADDYFHTKEYINMCKGFAKEVVQATESKTDEIQFLHKSVKFLEENDSVDLNEFKEQILVEEDKIAEFEQYKNMFENQHSVAIPDAFNIAHFFLQKQKKKIKNEIKLDTNIQIKISVNDSESTKKFIEQGFDHEKDMHFYKVYYNHELPN